MATTMFQSEEERIAYDPQVSEANVDEEERFVYDPQVSEANEEYEDWVHEQNMDAEFDMVEHHTGKNRKMAQNVRDKKLTKPKQDQAQKELYIQKIKEMAAAKQLKIQKTKERRADENVRNLERKDRQDVKDIGLDENQYDKDNFGDVDSCLVKDNWDDDLCDEEY
jgi:hypothetical protein